MSKRGNHKDFEKSDQCFTARRNGKIAIIAWVSNPGCFFLTSIHEEGGAYKKSDTEICLTLREALDRAEIFLG